MANAAAPTVGVGAEIQRPRALPLYLEVWVRLIKEKPLGTVGLAIVLLLFVTGIFASFIAPEGKSEPHTERVHLVPIFDKNGNPVLDSLGKPVTTTKVPGPSFSEFPERLMGYDNLGRSMVSRVIYGARISIIVALGTVLLGTTAATVVGMTSAWLGGKFDTFIQRIVDGWLVFPWLVLLISIMAVLPTDVPDVAIFSWMSASTWAMTKVIFALALGDVAWGARVIRSSALSVRQNQYVEAARAMGASAWRINFFYILPNIMAPIIILATLGLGYAILSEAAISFLGFGIPPPNPSWGAMLSLQGKVFFRIAPWVAIFPGLMVTLAVFGINMLGDALRDLLDPRLRGGTARLGT